MWLDTFNEMRRQSKMSLDELSEKSGVPKGTLTKISAGITKSPTLDTMKSLIYAMGYTLKDLDDGIPFSSTSEENEQPAPISESGPQYPPEYDMLTPANKAIVDRLIADLAKSQSPE